MSEPIPEYYIVQDRQTKRLIVCKLLGVTEGVPVLQMVPGRVYENLSDAIRGATFKPQAQEPKE